MEAGPILDSDFLGDINRRLDCPENKAPHFGVDTHIAIYTMALYLRAYASVADPLYMERIQGISARLIAEHKEANKDSESA